MSHSFVVTPDLPQVSGITALSAELAHRNPRAYAPDLNTDAGSQASTPHGGEIAFAQFSHDHRNARPLRKRPRDSLRVAQNSRPSNCILILATSTSMTDYQLSDRTFATAERINNRQASDDESITGLEYDNRLQAEPNIRRTIESPVRELGRFLHHDLLPQGIFGLDEYLIISEDIILPSLQAFEKRMIQQFVDGMEDEIQRAALVERLDQNGWTWKMTQEQVIAISRAERRQEAGGQTGREARENAGHEAHRSEPKRRSQRKKRKRYFW